jgi:hypothetical protein
MGLEHYNQLKLMTKIGEILDSREFRISTYEVMGYGHLKTLLRIYYHDRDEIILLEWVKGGTELETTHNWSEPHPEDHMVKSTKEWVKRYKQLLKI